MSEYEKIKKEWHDQLMIFFGESGRHPDICLIGIKDYWAFRGFMVAELGGDLRYPSADGGHNLGIEYKGIRLYRSYNVDRGYHFANTKIIE